MYLLDTDHLSIADRDAMEGFELGRRLAAVPPEQVAVTIITYEEQMRGWLALDRAGKQRGASGFCLPPPAPAH